MADNDPWLTDAEGQFRNPFQTLAAAQRWRLRLRLGALDAGAGEHATTQTPVCPTFDPLEEKSTWLFHQVLDFPTEFGRRDWTRTNDPHHVKVVL